MNTVPHARASTTLKTPAGPLGLTVDDRTHHASSVLVAPAPEAAMQRCPGTTRKAGRSGGQPRIVLCSASFFPFGSILHLLQQTQPSQGFCRTILPTPHLPISLDSHQASRASFVLDEKILFLDPSQLCSSARYNQSTRHIKQASVNS